MSREIPLLEVGKPSLFRFASFANTILRAHNARERMRGGNGVYVLRSESDWLISSDATGNGEPFSVCVEGTAVWSDNFDTEQWGFDEPLTKWNILDGTIDVIGDANGVPFVDLLPGHGRYVDLSGSIGFVPPGGSIAHLDATIETKDDIVLGAGSWLLKFALAGNNRQNVSNVRVQVDFGGQTDIITINNWQQDFRTYSMSVVGPVTTKIRFQQLPGPVGRTSFYGNLLDCVRVIPD